MDQIDDDDEMTENNVVDLEQVGSDDENNSEQQLEDEAPEEWLGGEQERIEQENEVQEQLLPRERQEDVDRGQHPRDREECPGGMINTKWEKTFRLEKDCIYVVYLK